MFFNFSQIYFIFLIIAKCIDEYIILRNKQTLDDKAIVIDKRLENIVEKMFTRCYNDNAYDQALGIAMESRRLDKVKL